MTRSRRNLPASVRDKLFHRNAGYLGDTTQMLGWDVLPLRDGAGANPARLGYAGDRSALNEQRGKGGVSAHAR
jgi:hypothetical protein